MSYAEDQDITEIPPYPDEWSPEQRVAAYWHALFFTNFPGTTEGWWAVQKSLGREESRRGRVIDAVKEQM